MYRHSLYINHQKVGPLIRELQKLVIMCKQQLDYQYESYEIRKSIYQEFIYVLTTQFYTQKDVKIQGQDIKDQDYTKFCQLTAKLEGLKNQIKIQKPFDTDKPTLKKGRPLVKVHGEDQFIQQIKKIMIQTGKLKFTKKQLDQKYKKFVSPSQKIPLTNSYLRLFKHENLKEIVIITRGQKQRYVSDLDKKPLKKEQFKAQNQAQESVKSQYVNQDLQSTSQLQSTITLSIGNPNGSEQNIQQEKHIQEQNSYKRMLRSSSKDVCNNQYQKRTKKRKTQKFSEKLVNRSYPKVDFFDDKYEDYNNQYVWQNLILEPKEKKFNSLNSEIYENSKSFQL